MIKSYKDMAMLEDLISNGERLKTTIRFIPPPNGVIRLYDLYGVLTIDDYETWKASCILFLKNNDFEDERNEFKKISDAKIHPGHHAKMLAILKAIRGIEETSNIYTEDVKNIIQQPISNAKVFIVHGHDEAMKLAVESFLKQIKLEPIVLNNQISQSKTVIEKLESYSDVGFAVVLLSPCDVGRSKNSEELRPRARQNVILELGYFMGRLGRNNVCTLKKLNGEEPSDFDGIIYVSFDEAGGWKINLAKELKAAGYSVDMNNLL
jgi:predicted nucleotide-binding protein